jgi:hypothetical protein
LLAYLGLVSVASAATDTVTNVADSGPGSLRATVAAAMSGDTIGFAPGVTGTITLSSGPISFSKDLTVDGPGAGSLTIDANGAQALAIGGGTVSISGLTFINGRATDGGAIGDTGSAPLAVSGCTFKSNQATGTGFGTGFGGAISTQSPVTVTDSSFISNSAQSGGAITAIGGVTVSDSTFESNHAHGTVQSAGTTTVTGYGGAIDNGEYGAGNGDPSGSVTVTASTFDSNEADIAGAIVSATVAIDHSTLTSNKAAGTVNVGGIREAFGGAVFVANNGSMTDDTVTGNSAAGGGGGVESGGGLTVSDSTFMSNTAGGFGGGGVLIASILSPVSVPGTIRDSAFVANSATGGSGGAIVLGGGGTLTNDTLTGNSAPNGSAIENGLIFIEGGISIEANSSDSLLVADTIDGNHATSAHGAALFGSNLHTTNGKSSQITAQDTIVASNLNSGGGIANCDAHVVATDRSLEGPAGASSCGFDLSSADPQLQPLADNGGPTPTQALAAGSSALDVIPVASCMTSSDQRGQARPDNSETSCDVGAFEFQDPSVSVTTPANGATYMFGAVPRASFTCSPGDGALTPGLAGCSASVDGGAPFPSGSALPGTVGPHTFVATATDTNGLTASVTTHYTVTKAKTTLTATATKRGLSISYTGKLTRTDNGAPIQGKTISFSVRGLTLGGKCHAVTDAGGMARCKATAVVLGKAKFKATFAGDADYEGSSATGTV